MTDGPAEVNKPSSAGEVLIRYFIFHDTSFSVLISDAREIPVRPFRFTS